MQPRNPDRDNPNIPHPERPDLGQRTPNIPEYDPNFQARGRGQQNQPNYDPWAQQQQQTPTQGQRPPGEVSADPYAAPSGSPYSNAEWKILLSVPLKAAKAMMLVAPSGPIGLIQEMKAMADSVKVLLSQDTSSSLINELKHTTERSMGSASSKDPREVLSDLLGPSKDPAQCREETLADCQQAAAILRKASPQDATEYKHFVYTSTLRVAEAAREGGVLGIGGQQVTLPEQELLRDISNALGIQRQ
jgi:hypothetical protein